MFSFNVVVFWLGSVACLAVFEFGANAAPVEDNSIYDKIEKINKKSSKKLFEGDIVPNWYQEAVVNGSLSENAKREGQRDLKALWVTRVIPYEITADFTLATQKAAIVAAMTEYESKTCLKFKPRTTEKQWLQFKRLDGCYSTVGRVYWKNGPQTISLGAGCLGHTTILHEIMHALGFWHEQSRPDRDSYVEVLWENIIPSEEHNFKKYSHLKSDVLGVAYDYQTIMHYGRRAFSKNGQPTLQSIYNGRLDLGQSVALSSSDVIQLNALYDCVNSKLDIWSSWSSYGPCNSVCKKNRQRFCSHQDLTQCVTANTYGVEAQFQQCTDAECYAPVAGHWGRWSSWTSCSHDCGPGKLNRTRVCDNPAPKYGGKECQGDLIGYKACLLKSCGLGKNDCEFDGQGWCQWTLDPDTHGSFQWRRISGKTPSSKTGPIGDHTTGTGSYLYSEASSPAQRGNKARIIGPPMDATNGLCMKFWYQMNGRMMGTLRVFIRSNAGVERRVWKMTGNQGDQWLPANKTIVSKKPFKVYIEAVNGAGYLSDMAVDDIIFTEGSCEKTQIETDCGIRMKPKGCYQDSIRDRVLNQMLISYRKTSSPVVVDWNNYESFLKRTLCDCAKAAKAAGNKYFGLQYYAECWTGQGDVVYDRLGSTTACVDGGYKECATARDAACTGTASTNYIYELL